MPDTKKLILIGGGHSHALLAKLWAEKPLPNVEVTLVSPQIKTPYSGMLPGLVAGHYQFDETHINLEALCAKTHIRFILGTVTQIDLQQKIIYIDQQEPIHADLISINTGTTPDLSIPGSEQHTIPVKPITGFYSEWQKIQPHLTLDSKTQSNLHIGIVGGGAAGVELVLAMNHYWQTQPIKIKPFLHILHPGKNLPEDYSKRTQRIIEKILQQKNIEVHNNFWVDRVTKNHVHSGTDRNVFLDHIFWCSQATAPKWPRKIGLDVNSKNFIAVDQYLRSTSHPWIFSAGDIADFTPNPHPKAGVYAVRQGPILFHNLQQTLLGGKLKIFHPQKTFLSLLACGDKTAVGGKYGMTVSGAWVWRWKNYLDKQFMRQF